MDKDFNADYSGVDVKEGGGIVVAPKGRYLAKVKKVAPSQSANGNPLVCVDWLVVDGPYSGTEIRYQNVTFLPKTHKFAGISLGVLKNLRQPYEGKFKIRPNDWLDKHAWIELDVEPYYSTKHSKNFDRNKVTSVRSPSVQELIELGENEEEFPQWLKEQAVAQASGPAKSKPPVKEPEEAPF